MANIFADGTEINIEDGQWRVYNTEGAYSLSPFFTAVKGTGLINYVPRFAEARGLPGTVLAADYIRAVVVGYDERRKFWAVGLYVAMRPEDKPRFVELAHWPSGEDETFAIDSHQAARILSEYIGVPLKLFGADKAPAVRGEGRAASKMTGTLSAVQQSEIDPKKVRIKAEAILLPLSLNGIALNGGRNSVTIRYAKEADQNGYNQCVLDQDGQLVKLIPPTGFLGARRGPQGRTIKFGDIRNVELRHTVVHNAEFAKDADGMMVDVSMKNHEYGVYLTLANESVLLLKLNHVVSNELNQRQMEKAFAGKEGFDEAERQMAYLRQHQQDQKQHDKITDFIEGAAYVIAASVMRPLLRSDSGDV